MIKMSGESVGCLLLKFQTMKRHGGRGLKVTHAVDKECAIWFFEVSLHHGILLYLVHESGRHLLKIKYL